MSNTQSMSQDRNYDLIPKLVKAQPPCTITDAPFYPNGMDSGNMIVPTADNRSYSMYSSTPGYKGYYDERCLAQPNTFVPCDLAYVYAPPMVTKQCWNKCDTVPCHVNCVVSQAK